MSSAQPSSPYFDKRMLQSMPRTPNKESQFAPSSTDMTSSARKFVSTNERQNNSSSPVKLSKPSDISPNIGQTSQPRFHLYQTTNDSSYFRRLLQTSFQSDMANASLNASSFILQQKMMNIASRNGQKLFFHYNNRPIPQGQSRPANLTEKHIRNYNQFMIEVEKNKTENQYYCSHCKDLLWEPVKCSDCPIHYCLSCANAHYTKDNKKCNSCHKLLVTVQAEEQILKQLQKISLMCPNQQNGCQAYLSYHSFEVHQQDCRFKKARGSENLQKPPTFFDTKKRESVPVMSTLNPLNTTTHTKEIKEVAPCLQCYKNFPKAELEQHNSICPLKLSPCQFCRYDVPIAHMKVHQQYRCSKNMQSSQKTVTISYSQQTPHTPLSMQTPHTPQAAHTPQHGGHTAHGGHTPNTPHEQQYYGFK